MTYDYCVIGGGIVGLATAMKLLEMQPSVSLVLLEKEAGLAKHQTGHNSGVIHAGIYYAPGSLKADFCRRGAKATKGFCDKHGIPYKTCGKLLVATNELEHERMMALVERARLNQIEFKQMDAAELKRREPNINGVGGLLLRETGVVDYRRVCECMASTIRDAGASIELNVKVTAIRETQSDVVVASGDRAWQAKKLVVCAGLQSDRLTRMAGIETDFQIVPFSRRILPAAAIEEPDRAASDLPDSRSQVALPGRPPDAHPRRRRDPGPERGTWFRARGLSEILLQSSRRLRVQRVSGLLGDHGPEPQTRHQGDAELDIQRGLPAGVPKVLPSLTLDDLTPCESGIRAQAVMKDGALVHDFLFKETARTLHVCNAPSPAATSAIPIGEMIANKMSAK